MSTHSNFSSAFKALNNKINLAKKAMVNAVANEGTKFWVSGFNKEGFTDKAFVRWKPRQVPLYSKIKRKDITRKILTKTGKLKREVNNSVVEKNEKRIVWKVSDNEVPYAKYLNDGTDDMPKREFMGESQELNRLIKKKIEDIMRKYVTK